MPIKIGSEWEFFWVEAQWVILDKKHYGLCAVVIIIYIIQ